MKETESIKLNRDFRRLYARGKCMVNGCIVIYSSKNRVKRNRLGLTTSKSIGNAVVRNRARRLMRESYRLLEDTLLSGYDFIIVARHRIIGKKCQQVKRDMYYALKKLGMIKNEENTDKIN